MKKKKISFFSFFFLGKHSHFCLLFLCLLCLSCQSFKDSSLFFRKIEMNNLQVEKLWVKSTLEDSYMQARFIHRTSPLIIHETLIQGNSIDGIKAYNLKTRKEKWRIDLKGGIESQIHLSGKNLYFGANDGHFYRADAKTGQIKWKFLLKSEGIGAPLIHDGLVYFLTGKDILFALNETSGKKVWAYKNHQAFSLFSIRGASRPAVYGDNIYVGFRSGDFLALNKKSGYVVRKFNLSFGKKFNDVDAEAIIDGNLIYISNYSEALYAFNLQTGREVWKIKKGSYLPITLHKDKIYYSTSNAYLLAIDKKSGKILWSLKSERGITTQALFYKNLLIYGESEGFLCFVDALSGRLLRTFNPGKGIMAKPIIEPRTKILYFFSYDANLFAIKLSWKSRRKMKLENLF